MEQPLNLVLFSGTDDKLQAAAVLTAGAAALGTPVNLLLQYWALDAFRADRIDRDHGLAPEVATAALALIGLFNVFGTYAAGVLGQRIPKRYLLAAIYLLRSVVIVVFLAAPLTPWSVYLFSAVMGLLWLSTVPPTNAVIAQIFGVRHLSMLGGFVFLSHQIGSFLGVWLGGALYDRSGSYDIVWWISIALGVFAALVNLPVREGAIARPAAVGQPA